MVNYKDVKEKRRKFGVSQEKLAELTNISRQAISMGERRNSKLTVDINEVFEKVFEEIERESKADSKVEMKNNKVSGGSLNSVVSNGNGSKIQVSTADISGMIELQKGYQKLIETSQSQLTESQAQLKESYARFDRLFSLLEQANNK